MNKKLIFTFFAVLILNIIPLLPDLKLIFHYKTIVLVAVALILWLSQPPFVSKEMNEDKQSDKLSLLFILMASCVSVLSSVVEWAYFTSDKSEFNFLTIIGLLFMITGTLLRVWSINILGKHFTSTVKITEEHKLIKVGPYKLIRHPSYLGAFIAISGCPLFLNNIISIFVSIAAMVAVYYFRITIEEKALSNYFGNSYEDYKKNTYRMLPLIW